jgi:hypothetical protein
MRRNHYHGGRHRHFRKDGGQTKTFYTCFTAFEKATGNEVKGVFAFQSWRATTAAGSAAKEAGSIPSRLPAGYRGPVRLLGDQVYRQPQDAYEALGIPYGEDGVPRVGF